VPLIGQLPDPERRDLFETARFVMRAMKDFLKTEAIQVTLQDGPSAGQTVSHVHMHVIPRHMPTVWNPSVMQSDELRNELAAKYAEVLRRRAV
jgi:bis(5'-adenosyl)-triphosphatase